MDAAGQGGRRRGRAAKLTASAAGSAAARVATLEKVIEQYRVLLETSAAITASTDLSETLSLITRLVTEKLGVAWCDLYDLDTANDRVEVVAYYQIPEVDIDSSAWVGTTYTFAEFVSMHETVEGRKPTLWYRDDETLSIPELADMEEWGELSSLNVPLIYRGEVIGIIDVGESRYMRRYSDVDVSILQAIADHAAIAIINARAYTRLERQAITDGLTGLSNHRHLDERLRQCVASAKRYDHDLSVLMIDVDDFKTYNDTFGHPQGDLVLIEIAGLMRQCVRADVDVVTRYGGEEFAVILPQTPVGGEGGESPPAAVVAERIRAAVAGHEFEGQPGYRDQRVMISVGVAGLGAASGNAEALLASADKALYLAKHQGKDRVAIFGGQGPDHEPLGSPG